MSVSDTLAQRQTTYGDFRDIARISGALQSVMRDTPNWDRLPPYMRESLQTIASKIARILNGDPYYADSWHDIAGYATLAEIELGGGGALPLASETAAPDLAVPDPGISVVFVSSRTQIPAGEIGPWCATVRDAAQQEHRFYGATWGEAHGKAKFALTGSAG